MRDFFSKKEMFCHLKLEITPPTKLLKNTTNNSARPGLIIIMQVLNVKCKISVWCWLLTFITLTVQLYYQIITQNKAVAVEDHSRWS